MYIYGLIDPRGPELFYVGITAKPSARLRKHRNLRNLSAGKKLRARIRAIHLGLVNTVRQAGTPYVKKTPEELSAICRATWFRRQGHPPVAPHVKKTHAELSAICKAVWAKKLGRQ